MLYVLICEEGTINISNGHMLKSIGVLTSDDILNAEKAPIVPYKHDRGVYGQDRDIYGGAWYNDLWNGIKKGAKFVKEDVLPVAKDVAAIARAVQGVGLSGGQGAGLSGGAVKPKRMGKKERERLMMQEAMNQAAEKMMGNGLSGGKMINRSQM